jgi:hypothetical protein
MPVTRLSLLPCPQSPSDPSKTSRHLFENAERNFWGITLT